MGGTSTDISLVLDGRPQVTREAALDGIPIRVPGHRHQRDRRRRRVDRVDRRGRRAAGRAEERRGGAGSRLLRPRRHGADRHRRQSRARPPRRRYAARRRADARRRGRNAGNRDPHRRAARPRRDRSGLRHPARRQRDDGARHPRRLGRARPRPAPPDAGAVRRRRADARLAAGARAGDPAPPRSRRPPAYCARSACWSPICGTIWCRPASPRTATCRPKRRARCSSRCWPRRVGCSTRTACPQTGGGSRCGSICAMSGNPTNCRSRLPASRRLSGRRWSRLSTPSMPAALATATRGRRSKSSVSGSPRPG